MRRFLALLCTIPALLCAAPVWAAISSPVNQNTKFQNSSASSTTIATTADIAINDLLVLSAANQSSRTLSSITGATGCTWTILNGGIFASNKHAAAAYCVATAAIPSGTVLTVNLSGASLFGVVLQSVTGVDPTTPVDLAVGWNSSTSSSATVVDASVHPSASTVGFGFTFSVDGEGEGMTPSAATTNGAFTAISSVAISGVGRLGQSWKIVNVTDQVTRVDTIGNRTWKAGTIWFKDAGIAPPAPTCRGNLQLLGVGTC